MLELVWKLLLAAALGALIGMERETHGRPAGLRTHILVSVGASLFTLCSFAMAGASEDPSRIAAQVVTGIGFLGAGTIFRQGNLVRGLTTAASLWTVAALGMAVAIGGRMAALAVVAGVLTYAVLAVVSRWERALQSGREERRLRVSIQGGDAALARVLGILAKHSLEVHTISREEATDSDSQEIVVSIRKDRCMDETTLSNDLSGSRFVHSFHWE